MEHKHNQEKRSGEEHDESNRPSAVQIEALLKSTQRKQEIRRGIFSTLSVLIVIAAALTLLFSLWLPIVQVQRGSMSPTLVDGDLVVFVTTGEIKRGDIIAFHHGSQILVKRAVAIPGDIIDINNDGTVMLNNELLTEQYINAPSSGEISVELPCQLLDDRYFVLGDHRQTSIDSRNAEIGTVRRDQIIGKAIIKVWPIDSISVKFGS